MQLRRIYLYCVGCNGFLACFVSSLYGLEYTAKQTKRVFTGTPDSMEGYGVLYNGCFAKEYGAL